MPSARTLGSEAWAVMPVPPYNHARRSQRNAVQAWVEGGVLRLAWNRDMRRL